MLGAFDSPFKLVAFTFLIGISAGCTPGNQQQVGAPAESQLAESTGCLQDLGVTDDELTELRRVMLVTELVSLAQLDVPDHCLLASAVCTGGGLSDPALDGVWEKASFPESRVDGVAAAYAAGFCPDLT